MILTFRNNLLRPNEMTQRDILAGAISELLWKVKHSSDETQFTTVLYKASGNGQNGPAVIAVPGANQVFEAPVRFSVDGLTEKLHLFKCSKEEELKNLMKRHIYYVRVLPY